jgi:hypothetical protein
MDKLGSLKFKIILPIDRLEQNEDGVSAVRIRAFKYGDVKVAVLDNKKEILHKIKWLKNHKTLSKETKQIAGVLLSDIRDNLDIIFGDFEK